MGKEYDLRDRTMRFALNVYRLCRQFPDSYEGHRAACRARSKPDFIAKLGTAIEEGDEADFWMDFGVQAGLLKRGIETALRKEADELIRILIQSQVTAKENMQRAKEAIHHS